MIIAGMRTAAVAVVATATLAALIAGGGLGRYIVDGFALQDQAMLVGGAILVALLAVATERLSRSPSAGSCHPGSAWPAAPTRPTWRRASRQRCPPAGSRGVAR